MTHPRKKGPTAPTTIPCPACNGAGTIRKSFLLIFRWNKVCATCGGAGQIKAPTFPPALRVPTTTPPAATPTPDTRTTPAEREERPRNEGGNPLTAALVAGAMGGDPLTAAATTALTGSTDAGILVGGLSRYNEPGGEFGGAGSSGVYGDRPSNREHTVPTTSDPVIADPFGGDREDGGGSVAVASASAGESDGGGSNEPTSKSHSSDGGGSTSY